MERLEGFYGAYFMKGAFYFDVKEVDGDLIANALHSRKCKQIRFISGVYGSLKALLKSPKGKYAQKYIKTLDFDFIIIGYGKGVHYYINAEKGLKKCKATYIQ